MLFFFNLLVLSLVFESYLFMFAKHYKNRGFNIFCVLCCSNRRKQKMITGIFVDLGLFVRKRPSRDGQLFFINWFAETPMSIVFWGRRFLGQVVKNIFGPPPPQKKTGKLTDNWKAHFLVCFGFSRFFFVCFFVVFVFWGFKHQVRWPEGPPHLALNPPYFGLFVFFDFVLEGLRVRWGGPKGHFTWP